MLSCLLCLTYCQRDPWASGFLTSDVVDKDIVGTYFIDVESQKRVVASRWKDGAPSVSNSAKIVLSRDHRAEFIDVPLDHAGRVCLVTGRGSWRLTKNDSFTEIMATIVNTTSSGLVEANSAAS